MAAQHLTKQVAIGELLSYTGATLRGTQQRRERHAVRVYYSLASYDWTHSGRAPA